MTRIDPASTSPGASGSPAAAIGADTFSARWTGQVEAPFTGTYTFYTVSDDGVRLWVNGVQLVNHWTNHCAVEDSGTIALDRRAALSSGWSTTRTRGSATARLLWSHAVDHQGGGAREPALSGGRPVHRDPDQLPAGLGAGSRGLSCPTAASFTATRGNGQTYGWNADNTAQARDRNSARSPDQAYDTLTHMQRPANPNAVWEIALPNGTYSVRLVAATPRTSTASTASPPKACWS